MLSPPVISSRLDTRLFVRSGADFRGLFLVERRVNRARGRRNARVYGKESKEKDRKAQSESEREEQRLHEDNPKVCACVWSGRRSTRS